MQPRARRRGSNDDARKGVDPPDAAQDPRREESRFAVRHRCLALWMLIASSGSCAQDFVEESDRVRPCSSKRSGYCCGDGKCEGPETIANCMADCPGVTTAKVCGEEPHSDTGGAA
eukprot:1973498-Prymnesium_polylepis.1